MLEFTSVDMPTLDYYCYYYLVILDTINGVEVGKSNLLYVLYTINFVNSPHEGDTTCM